MPKLLIVNYLFPPAGGIAVQRVLSLAKHLPQCGYDVHVLAAWNAATPVVDATLLAHVPPSVKVHHAFTPELPFETQKRLWSLVAPSGSANGSSTKGATPAAPSWKGRIGGAIKRALTPDPQVVWVPFALAKARNIIRKHAIDAVLISTPPFSTVMVGNALKREFPHLKLITDFRDEWLSFYLKDFEFQGSSYTRERATELERATVEHSDLVVAVTESSRQTIRERYPDQPERKFVCVHNGYDAAALAGFQAKPSQDERVIVTHMGTAYKTASPRYYMDAVDGLPEEIRSRIVTRFIGRISEEERSFVEGRRSRVELLGFKPQPEALREAAVTDYLLLTMTNDISLPGKLFEYLAMEKPILALSPAHGEVHRILAETRAGWCVDHADVGAIQAMLTEACRRKGEVGWFRPDLPKIAAFERRSLAESYGGLIHDLLGAPAAQVSK